MWDGRTWVKIGVSAVFVMAASCCGVLSFQMLRNEHDQESGIITFIFSFTNIHVPTGRLVTSEDIAGKDIIPPLSSAEGIAATVISSVTSQAKSAASAASAAATAIPGASIIEKLIPRNCSLGTKKFCVGFSNRIECHDLPLNVSNVLPEALTNLIGDQVQDLRSLEGILAKLTSGFVQDWLISGLVFGLVMAALFAYSIVGRPYGLFLQPLALALKLTVGLVCVVSFLVPAAILNILCSKSQRLQSNVQAKKGDVSGYSLVALFCVVVMMVLTVLTPDFVAKFSP